MIKVASQPAAEAPTKSLESAERSQAVQSANWKEHMLLQRKLHILNRSERNLVHRITIDQKVMFRRFQLKLHRSKLAFAEMMGDKEKVMELRGLHLHDLNTNCGQNESDYAFLAKLEYRPCTASGLGSTKSSARPRSKEEWDIGSDKSRGVKEQRVRSMSASARYISPKESKYTRGDLKLPEADGKLPARPATAAGTHIEKEYHILSDVRGESTEDKIHSFVARMNRKNKKDDQLSPDLPVKGYGRQSQVSFAKHLPQDTSVAVAGSSASSRRGSTSSTRRSQARKGSMFEEVKKLNFLQLYLSEAKAVDHVPKVKEFCESIKEYENTYLDKDFDYYPQKIQIEAAQARKDDPFSIPGTPDSENNKFIGDTRVKSLTMPLLNLNFDSCQYSTTEGGEGPSFAMEQGFESGDDTPSVEND